MYWNVLFHITAWKSNAPAGNKTKVTGLYTRLKHQKGNDFPYTQQDHQTLPSMHSIWFFSMSACKTTLYFSTLFTEKIGVYKYIYICICVRILCTHIMYAYYIYISLYGREAVCSLHEDLQGASFNVFHPLLVAHWRCGLKVLQILCHTHFICPNIDR